MTFTYNDFPNYFVAFLTYEIFLLRKTRNYHIGLTALTPLECSFLKICFFGVNHFALSTVAKSKTN